MKVSFELTMPNVGSWNGKWTGADKKYFIIKSYSQIKKRVVELLHGEKYTSWYYRWEDGWGANVTMEVVDDKEARRRQKISKGFCGYNWMVDSILKYDQILARHEIPTEETVEFKCAKCNNVYKGDGHEIYSHTATSVNFGPLVNTKTERVKVCPDCYKQIHEILNPSHETSF